MTDPTLGTIGTVLLTAVFSGGFSALLTIAGIKADINWIKATLKDHDEDLKALWRRVAG